MSTISEQLRLSLALRGQCVFVHGLTVSIRPMQIGGIMCHSTGSEVTTGILTQRNGIPETTLHLQMSAARSRRECLGYHRSRSELVSGMDTARLRKVSQTGGIDLMKG